MFSHEDAIVQLFCVKNHKRDSESVELQDVGLKGITRLSLPKGGTVFQGIKFITTSYYHEVSHIFALHASTSIGNSFPLARRPI